MTIRLRAIAAERERLRAQLQGLPLAQLRQLDRAEQQRAQVAEQRAAAAAALAGVPAPRRRLGRPHDPAALQRARLTDAIDAADAQLAALERQHAQLHAHVGPADQLRSERDGLHARLQQLAAEQEALLDRAVDSELARFPDWLTRALAERPAARLQARRWERAARALARYRIEHEIPDHVDGAGPKPERDHDRPRWRAAQRQLDRAQRALAADGLGRGR